MKKLMTVLFFMSILFVYSQIISDANWISRMWNIKTAASKVETINPEFSVKTMVNGNDVFLECYVPNYHFTQSKNRGLASIVVTIDGKKQSIRKTAAFILKDLSNGRHTIKLDLIQNGKKIGLSKELDVHIHSSI